MFEGLLAPWHLVVLAAVLFVVVGPRRIVRHWHDTTERLQHLGERAPGEQPRESSSVRRTANPSWSYRLGRMLRKRRS